MSPQCPRGEWWLPVQLSDLLDDVMTKYRVDPNQVYCTGLSMGGFGTWATAMEYPERFAAIAPICGGGDPADVERIKGIPIWVFHGARDRIVPLEASEKTVDALRKAKGNVWLTVYPDAAHNSWSATYANEHLYSWLLANRRGTPVTAPPVDKSPE